MFSLSTQELLLSSNDLEDLLERSKDSSFLDVEVGETVSMMLYPKSSQMYLCI